MFLLNIWTLQEKINISVLPVCQACLYQNLACCFNSYTLQFSSSESVCSVHFFFSQDWSVFQPTFNYFQRLSLLTKSLIFGRRNLLVSSWHPIKGLCCQTGTESDGPWHWAYSIFLSSSTSYSGPDITNSPKSWSENIFPPACCSSATALTNPVWSENLQ